jgi:hypothetical protein
VFTCVGTVLAVLFATNLVNLFAPWTDVNLNHVADPSSHRWHHAFEGANDLFAVVLIVALLLKPLARQLLAQHITVAACLSAILVLPFVGPMYLLILASLLLVPATYPRPAKLLQFRSDAGVSRPVLLVAAGAAALLLARAAQEMHWQLTGYLGEHATSNAWIGDAAHLVILAAAGLLAATRLPATGCSPSPWQPSTPTSA